MDETKAIRLCIIHRDPAGFEFLVKKFRKEALYHAVSITGNYDDAADACQESFFKAFTAITRLKKLDRFYPWFYVILRNSCFNLIRKRGLIEKREGENHTEEDHSGGPEFLFEKKEESDRIWDTLSRLKTEFREIILMKYSMRMNYEEISSTLGIPRGTVMSRLYNARRSFRDNFVPDQYPSNKKKGGKNGKEQLPGI